MPIFGIRSTAVFWWLCAWYENIFSHLYQHGCLAQLLRAGNWQKIVGITQKSENKFVPHTRVSPHSSWKLKNKFQFSSILSCGALSGCLQLGWCLIFIEIGCTERERRARLRWEVWWFVRVDGIFTIDNSNVNGNQAFASSPSSLLRVCCVDIFWYSSSSSSGNILRENERLYAASFN